MLAVKGNKKIRTFAALCLLTYWIKKFCSPIMQNRQFIFESKMQYSLTAAERSGGDCIQLAISLLVSSGAGERIRLRPSSCCRTIRASHRLAALPQDLTISNFSLAATNSEFAKRILIFYEKIKKKSKRERGRTRRSCLCSCEFTCSRFVSAWLATRLR
jgi:hypothetical protein